MWFGWYSGTPALPQDLRTILSSRDAFAFCFLSSLRSDSGPLPSALPATVDHTLVSAEGRRALWPHGNQPLFRFSGCGHFLCFSSPQDKVPPQTRRSDRHQIIVGFISHLSSSHHRLPYQRPFAASSKPSEKAAAKAGFDSRFRPLQLTPPNFFRLFLVACAHPYRSPQSGLTSCGTSES